MPAPRWSQNAAGQAAARHRAAAGKPQAGRATAWDQGPPQSLRGGKSESSKEAEVNKELKKRVQALEKRLADQSKAQANGGQEVAGEGEEAPEDGAKRDPEEIKRLMDAHVATFGEEHPISKLYAEELEAAKKARAADKPLRALVSAAERKVEKKQKALEAAEKRHQELQKEAEKAAKAMEELKVAVASAETELKEVLLKDLQSSGSAEREPALGNFFSKIPDSIKLQGENALKLQQAQAFLQQIAASMAEAGCQPGGGNVAGSASNAAGVPVPGDDMDFDSWLTEDAVRDLGADPQRLKNFLKENIQVETKRRKCGADEAAAARATAAAEAAAAARFLG